MIIIIVTLLIDLADEVFVEAVWVERWFIGDLMDSLGSQLYVWEDLLIHLVTAHTGSCRPFTLAGEGTATLVFLCERPLNFLAWHEARVVLKKSINLIGSKGWKETENLGMQVEAEKKGGSWQEERRN